MSVRRFCIICVAILGMFAFLNSCGSIEGSDESQSELYILLDDGNEFTKSAFSLTTNDLLEVFPEGLVYHLLDGEPVLLSSSETLDVVWRLMDMAEGNSVEHSCCSLRC